MICAMCLTKQTPNESIQLCTDCMGSLKYAEDIIKREGVGLKVTYNKAMEVDTTMPERGDLSPVPEPVETAHWVVEMTAVQDRNGTVVQPIYEGKADSLKDACDMALTKLLEDSDK